MTARMTAREAKRRRRAAIKARQKAPLRDLVAYYRMRQSVGRAKHSARLQAATEVDSVAAENRAAVEAAV